MANLDPAKNPINLSKEISRHLIDKYFRTVLYPYTKHHIDSYDNFLKQDLIGIIKSQNPVLILKDLIEEKDTKYRYRVEIYIGGESGDAIEIGTPTLSLQNTEEVRILYPNEARLRNLSYVSTVYADIAVKIKYTDYVYNNATRKTELQELDFSIQSVFTTASVQYAHYDSQ